MNSESSPPLSEEKGHERLLAALQSVNHKASSNGHFCEPGCFMAALLAGWIKDIKVNFNIGPLTPTRREIFMMQHKRSQGGRVELDILAGYCEASSCLRFCVHDTPIKLIRRFELFSYLIQFVTGCKLGSVFTNKHQVPV